MVVDEAGDRGTALEIDRRVAGVASAPMSRFDPTATMRSARIATASAIVKRSSTVMILPFVRMMSAGCGWDRAIVSRRHDTGQRQHAPGGWPVYASTNRLRPPRYLRSDFHDTRAYPLCVEP